MPTPVLYPQEGVIEGFGLESVPSTSDTLDAHTVPGGLTGAHYHPSVNGGVPFANWGGGAETPEYFGAGSVQFNIPYITGVQIRAGYEARSIHQNGIGGFMAHAQWGPYDIAAPPRAYSGPTRNTLVIGVPTITFSNVSSYSLESSPDGVTWTRDLDHVAANTSHSYTGLTANTIYQFRCIAHCTSGDITSGNFPFATTHDYPKSPNSIALTTAANNHTPAFSYVFRPDDPADTQSAHRIVINYGGTTFYDSGKVTSTASTIAVPTALANNPGDPGHYFVSITTWGQFSATESDVGAYDLHLTDNPPTAENVRIIAGNPTTSRNPTINFDFTDVDAGDYQTASRLRITDCDGTLLYDSGKVTGTQAYMAVGTLLPFDAPYHALVTVWDSWNTPSVADGTLDFKVLSDLTQDIPNRPNSLALSTDAHQKNSGFTWAFSHPDVSITQSAFQLRITLASGGGNLYNSGKVVSNVGAHQVPNTTRLAPNDYTVFVRTWDTRDHVGCERAFNFTILNRAPNAPTSFVMTNANPTFSATPGFSWVFSDPDTGDIQSAFQFRVIPRAGGSDVYNSGSITSLNNTFAIPSGAGMTSGLYTAKVKAWDQSGTVGPEASFNFEIQGICPSGQHWDGTACVVNGTSNPHCCSAGFIWSDDLGRCVPGTFLTVPPAKPDPPIVVAISGQFNPNRYRIRMGSPAWDTIDGQATTTMILEEQVEGDLITWVAPNGTYDDVYSDGILTIPASRSPHVYRVRSCNSEGCTASDWVNVPVLGAGVAWQSSADAETVSHIVPLRFTAPHGSTDPQITANGLLLAVPTLVASDNTIDTYEVLWDTRDYFNGTTVLECAARVLDLWSIADITVNVLNTLASGIIYRDYEKILAYTGYRITVAHFALENYPVSPVLNNDYWLEVRAKTTDSALTWAQMQPVALQPGESYPALGIRPARQQLYKKISLLVPGDRVIVRVRLTPQYPLEAWATGAAKIAKIRQISDGLYYVLTSGPAKLYTFDGTTFKIIIDLSTVGAGDACDAAIVADKVYVVRNTTRGSSANEFFMLDTDEAPQAQNIFVPRGETRKPAFVENVNGKLLALFVDSGLSSNRTRAYLRTPDEFPLVWTLNAAVNAVMVGQDTPFPVGFAAGVDLYGTVDPAVLPTLNHSFAASITALDPVLAGLSSGQIQEFNITSWSATLPLLPASVQAVTRWTPDGVDDMGAAGINTNVLYLQGTDGLWYPDRVVAPPGGVSGTVTEITALFAYKKIITPAVGAPSDATYVPAVVDSRLMIGTGDSGIFFTLEKSLLSQANGAWPTSGFMWPEIEVKAVEAIPVVT